MESVNACTNGIFDMEKEKNQGREEFPEKNSFLLLQPLYLNIPSNTVFLSPEVMKFFFRFYSILSI